MRKSYITHGYRVWIKVIKIQIGCLISNYWMILKSKKTIIKKLKIISLVHKRDSLPKRNLKDNRILLSLISSWTNLKKNKNKNPLWEERKQKLILNLQKNMLKERWRVYKAPRRKGIEFRSFIRV